MRLPGRSTILAVPLFALAAALLGGCDDASAPPANVEAEFYPVAPTENPTEVVIPFPFDGLFAGFSAPTLNIPNSSNISFVAAGNEIDGFSTVGDIFFDIAQFVDYTTVPQHLVIINTATGQPLVYGTDFTIQPEVATEANAITGQVSPISSTRSRVLIEPMKPLSPSTTYLVAVTSGIKTKTGGTVVSGPQFQITSSATPVSGQSSAYLNTLTSDQKNQLEAIRAGLIYPAVAALGQAGLPASDIVLAWPFTTQSIGKSLAVLAQKAAPSEIAVQATGIDTSEVVGVAGADIYAGVLGVPYYLGNSGGSQYSSVPLTSFWLADATQPDLEAIFLGQVPCGAFATGATVNGVVLHASASTTTCYPVPVQQSEEVIPLLVTVPNSASGQAKPLNGWPVVVFQHGIGGDRTNMLAIAPALAQAGFAVVAIDLPLHGITDTTNPFYRNQLFTGSPAAGLITGERTFDLDLENNSTGAPGTPDGVIDPSGTWFINLGSLLTSRDNLRQGEADLMTLTQSLALLDLDHDGHPDLDTTQIRFNGISLGSITGVPFLANNTAVGAASLAVPGGGIAKLLDGSKTFGPEISAGLAAAGVNEGTDDYETFMRFAQQAVDDGDPLNYAAAARAGHPLHLIEVIGDTVIPNNTLATGGTASEDRVVESSLMGGTDPLIAALGLGVIGPIDVPASASLNTGANLGYAVKFNQGYHGSLLDPSVNADATTEMQRETANFLLSNGTCLPIGGNCPAP